MVNLFKKITETVVKAAAPVMNPLTVAFVHPIQTIKAITGSTTMKELEQKHFAQPLKKQITETVMAGAGYAGAVVGGAAIGASIKAGTLLPQTASIAKSLIPTTLKGKAIAAVAAPVAVGAVISQPAKTLGAIVKTPSALANVGGNLANLVANPNIESAKILIKENPLIVGGAAAAAAATGFSKILPALATIKQTEAIKEQTAAIKKTSGLITVIDKSEEMKNEKEKVYSVSTTPTTPKTEIVTKGGDTKLLSRRKKRTGKVISQNINQRVNVVVANRTNSTGIKQNKNYIKREVLFR